MTRQRAGTLATAVALVAVLLTPAAVLAAPPVAVGDAYSMNEDDTLNINAAAGVLGNDSDPDLDPKTAVKDSDPTNGTLSLAADGSFTYDPDADFNGTDTFTYHVEAGGESSNSATVTITITAINDPPSGVLDTATMAVSENSGAASDPGRVTGITGGPPDEPQAVTFTVTPVNAALFSAGPAISSTGTLTFTPAANANGSTSVSVSISDGITTVALSGNFTITISAVNDPPTGTLDIVTMTVLEDSVAANDPGRVTGITGGPPDEPQAVTFTVTVTPGTTALFATQPAISPTGTLTFTPAANRAGSTSVSVSISDGGTSVTLGSFTITITAVNDPPSGILDTATMTVNEDSGAASDPGRVGTVTNGGPDEAGQTITFTVTPVNAALFSAGPAISSTGTLTFTPALNVNGSTLISVAISDGVVPAPIALTGSFTITIRAVNDPPTFVLGPPPTVIEDSGIATIPSFLTGISPGPANESGQVAAAVLPLTVASSALFATQPTISPTGTLTFRPSANRTGSSLVTVNVLDDGGTANGGDDTGTQSFTITVAGANDPPIAADDPEAPAESYPVQAGVLTPLDVLANDTTLPDVGETLTIVSATGPGHGTVTIAAGGVGLSYRSTIGYLGSDTFRYTISDGFSTATADVYVTVADTLPPVLGTPTSRFVTGAQLTSTVKVRLGWSASDPGSGVKSYDVQRSTNGGTSWTTIFGATTATHVTRSLAFWKTYTYRFRARDRRNRLSAWSSPMTITPTRHQESTALATYSSGWRSATISSASGNHTRYATANGSSTSFTFTGRAVSLVSPRGSTRGKAEIRVDGLLVATVNLHRRSRDPRRHVWSRSWASVATHVVSVTVLGTSGHPRFDIDAWTVLR